MNTKTVTEAQEPSFLSILRAQAGGRDPHRQERPAARPQRAKASADDDVPTFVDEADLNISKQDYKALTAGREVVEAKHKSTDGDENLEDIERRQSHDLRKHKQEITEVGKAQKKRRAVKVATANAEEDEGTLTTKVTNKTKKRTKVSALSFGGGENCI